MTEYKTNKNMDMPVIKLIYDEKTEYFKFFSFLSLSFEQSLTSAS